MNWIPIPTYERTYPQSVMGHWRRISFSICSGAYAAQPQNFSGVGVQYRLVLPDEYKSSTTTIWTLYPSESCWDKDEAAVHEDGWREMPDENDEKRLLWWFGKAQEEHDEVVDTHSNILCTSTHVIVQFLLYAPLTFFAELFFQVPNYLHIYDGRLR